MPKTTRLKWSSHNTVILFSRYLNRFNENWKEKKFYFSSVLFVPSVPRLTEYQDNNKNDQNNKIVFTHVKWYGLLSLGSVFFFYVLLLFLIMCIILNFCFYILFFFLLSIEKKNQKSKYDAHACVMLMWCEMKR